MILSKAFATPTIIAHRGGAKEAPENTLSAFSYSGKEAFDFIELDVRSSKEGVPVVIHDANTYRNYGKNMLVSSLTLPELKGLSFRKREEKIPTLQEALSVCSKKIGVMIEMKGDGVKDFAGFARNVLEAVEPFRENFDKEIYIGSFYPQIVNEIQKQCPGQDVIFIVKKKQFLSLIEELEPKIVAVHYSLLSKSLVESIHALGIKVWVWTVDSVSQMQRYLLFSIDGIITDRPAKIRKALEG